jgi:hypothetical protein
VETTHAVPVSGTSPAPSAPLSIWQRTAAVFTRPAHAWGGLETRAQWWFPLLVILVSNVLFVVALSERAIMPTQLEQMQAQVDSGQMSREQYEHAEAVMTSGAGMVFSVVPVAVVVPILMLIYALLMWFAVGFVLGARFRYRLALEVVTWSWLVSIPALIVTAVLAWSRETMKVHVGFGILLPESDSPGKLMTGLGVLLDGLGPLSLWPVVVAILGAAALSGAPRKSVAWVVGGLYVAVLVFAAALAAMFTPGA